MRARPRTSATPFGTAFVAMLLGVALAVSGCAWGSSAADDPSATPTASTGDGSEGADGSEGTDDTGGTEGDGPVAVGSPIVTPTALEAAGNPLGTVRDLLDTWAEDNCDDPDCLVYEVDPKDATDECIYVGSDPGPGVKVEEGSTVVLFADCDDVRDPDEPDEPSPDEPAPDELEQEGTSSSDVGGDA